MKINQKIRSLIVGLMFALNLAYVPAVALAEIPPIPTAPAAPSAPDPNYIIPDVPTIPTVTYTIPPVPTAPTTQNTSSGSGGSTETSPSSATNTGNGAGSHNSSNYSQTSDTEVVDVNNANVVNNQDIDVNSGYNDANKNMGDASVTTGDAGVSSGLVTDINNNFITIGDLCGQGCSEDFVAANLKNGYGTLNNANGSLTNLVILNNQNNLNLANYSKISSNTGNNEASKNMGSGTIVSGDADVSFTTINFGNNNGINAAVANYDIIDDSDADLWIMFPTGVASGSGLGSLGAVNSGNGADSTNSANSSETNFTQIDNTNNLQLTNDVNLAADTGHNTADYNMGAGNITTGDANIVSNVVNFLNNNIVAGAQWLISTVNIFGNMTGNIILPREAGLEGCGCSADITAGNIGNGAGSNNSANTNVSDTTLVNNLNNAVVTNNINLDGNTGGNNTDKNMGDSSISSGNVNVDSNLVTVANTNSVGQGDTWWLVIVNNNGNYTGQIVGADGMIAGSGLQFGVSPSGTVYALNSGNGADSDNSANTNSNSSTEINTTNNATINNNINIKANTGDNSASKNMQGADIKTGDINVMSNIVNFVNNNFVGTKFIVTVVNIFGSFSGKIVPPDQAVPTKTGVGGQSLPVVSLPSSQTISHNSNNKTTGSGSGVGGVSQSLQNALLQGGNLLSGATKVAGSSTDTPITKVINQPKSSFNFNLLLLASAVLVLVGYSLLARRKAS